MANYNQIRCLIELKLTILWICIKSDKQTDISDPRITFQLIIDILVLNVV